MITIFNRRLLISTYDMTVQSRIRGVLSANKVEYFVNPVMGLYGSVQPEYKIYVRKKDYEKACYLTKGVFR